MRERISSFPLHKPFEKQPPDTPLSEVALRLVANFYTGEPRCIGTAFSVCGSILVTARHVLEEFFRSARPTSDGQSEIEQDLVAIQLVMSEGVDYFVWEPFAVIADPASDLAVIHLAAKPARSPDAKTRPWRSPHIEPFAPKIGDRVCAFGYREGRIVLSKSQDGGRHLDLNDEPMMSVGIVREVYEWRRDFLGVIGKAAERGVVVKVLADAWGSVTTGRAFWREMKRRGIEARLFNPLFPLLALLQPFRDHRKILVVDRETAFTGGMNISDEYGSAPAPGAGRAAGPWRDTHARVDGPAAWELAVVFSEAWRRAGGSPLDLPPLQPPPPGGASIRVLDSRPGRGYAETASVLAAIVAAARERLWVTNAYFAPGPRAVRLLSEAAARGVDVRLLLPGRTDVPVVRHAGHGYYLGLLESGIRVFEYGGPVLHAKTLVADDLVSVVGSTNLDFRSFNLNAECNLVILDDDTGRALAEAFREDLRGSVEISRERWAGRPLLHRWGDAVAKGLRPLL